MVAEIGFQESCRYRMPKARWIRYKRNQKNKEEQYTDSDETATRPNTLPNPKISSINADYVDEIRSEEAFNRARTTYGNCDQVYRNQVYRNSNQVFHDLQRRPANRRRATRPTSTTSGSTFIDTAKEVPRMPRMQRLTNRLYTRLPAPPTPRRSYRSPSPPRREYATIRRSNTLKRPLPQLHRPTEAQDKYRKSFTFSVNTEEPTTLVGDITQRKYAHFPEHSSVRADSHIRGKLGEVTYQASSSTQTTNPWLSTFERDFSQMKL
jgi:hypothetical protein